MRIIAVARTVAQAVRSAWIVAGLSLVFFLLFEGTYRVAGRVKQSLVGDHGGLRPDSLARLLAAQEDSSLQLEWRPYVYFRRRPFAGSFYTVGSDGLRRTPEPVLHGRVDSIFFFGGSTTWGSFQRDSFTLAARTGAVLRARGRPVSVRNYGETGYVLNQGAITLWRELQRGAQPRVVVSYDGINDIAALAQSGEPGVPQNEGNRIREFQTGRRLFDWRSDARTDLRAVGTGVTALAERSRIISRLRTLLPSANPQPADPTADTELAVRFVDQYVATARLYMALGNAEGFCPVLLWQPSLQNTRKPLTAFEKQLDSSATASPFGARLKTLHTAVLAELRRREAAGTLPPVIAIVSDAFDAESEAIFTDEIGHTNERGTERLLPVVTARVLACLDRT